MTRKLFFFAAAIQFGCNRTLPEILFDSSKINGVEKHLYKYDASGRIVSDRQVNFSYTNGVPIDSNISRKSYVYFKKRKLKYSIDKSEHQSDSTIFLYNEVDSLVAKYVIRDNRDTVTLWEYKFDKNGNKIQELFRWLHPKLKEAFEKKDRAYLSQYDTTFERNEFIYEGKNLIKTKVFDIHGKLNREFVTIHKDSNSELVEVYSFLDTVKYISSSYHERYLNGRAELAYSLTTNGDTAFIHRSYFTSKGKLLKRTFSSDQDFEVTFYDSLERKFQTQEVSMGMNSKMYYQYKYDSHGNPIEILNYKEKLIAK